MATFVCPSESISTGPWQVQTWTNYAANIGGPPSMGTWSGVIIPMQENTQVAIQTNYPSKAGTVSIASLTDGTSNSVAFCERLIGLPSGNYSITSSNAKRVVFGPVSGMTADSGNPAQALAFVQACRSLPGTTTTAGTSNNVWIAGAVWAGSHGNTLRFNSYSHVNTPNGISCMAENYPPGQAIDAMSPSSNHPGGVNAGMADGSVRYIKDTISVQTWWALGTRAGGEIISSDSY